ncbi:peptidase domain-containing ABC transporter [Fibrella aquatica]|uniref:peptidase domain-containing ABC transporter n=1 Tax=Fibrella aquatica TaxID=3242487 RepID=UPI00351FB81C
MKNPFRSRQAALPGLDVGLLEKTLIRQQGQSDCGVACLASLLAYYGGHSRLERLRELSGTDSQGTTLLGLCQAARQIGFDADGMQADSIENLKTDVSVPVVLHVLIDNVLQHYVVCYGWDAARQQFLIGDPARGVHYQTTDELAAIWTSLVLLHPAPTERLVKQADERKQQRTWLFELVRADIPLLAIATGLGIVTALLGLSTAIFSQKLVDEILPKHDTKRLMLGVGLLAFLLVAGAGVGFLRGLLLNRQSRDFNNRIVNQFYGSLLRLPKSFFDSRKTGELIARLNDTGRIQRTISHLTGAVIINALVVLISAGYIFTYAVPVGLLTLLSIPLFAALVWRYHRRIINGQREVMAASARTESNYVDTIQGIDVIKTANRESFFSAITKTVYGRYQDQAYALGTLGLRFNLTAEVIAALLITAILGAISWLVVQKTMQLGEMMAVLTLVGTIIPAVVSLSLTNIQLQEAHVAFDRMYEYANLQPEPTEHVPDPAFAFESLAIQGLDFRFPGRALLLDTISLNIRRGECVTLLGESGSGKSTLLQVLQRFYTPENGQLLINGHDWHQIDVPTWRTALGVVPQQIKLFSGTLLDNICLSHTAKEAEAIVQFCRDYGFSTYFEQFPQGYLTILGEDGVNLSGGQRQLVALARALYQRPQLLLLDEPTAAMDRHTERFVLNLLTQLQPQVGILLITHKAQHSELADRTYLLDNKQLVRAVEIEEAFAPQT